MTHPNPRFDAEHYRPFLAKYVAWLEKEDFHDARHWCARLRSNDPAQIEAAISEAVAWDWLRCRVDKIDRVRTGRTRTPDFRCTKNGRTFFVEVTNISLERMTRLCGLEHADHSSGFRTVPQPDGGIQNEIAGKVQQGAFASAPYVVLVTTLHDHGSRRMQDDLVIEWVLTSRPALGMTFDPSASDANGGVFQFVDFDRAAFQLSGSVVPARRTVSAAVFGPFGRVAELMTRRRWEAQGLVRRMDPRLALADIRARGILHPDALHPFAPELLDDVNFCSFKNWPPRQTVEVQWSHALG